MNRRQREVKRNEERKRARDDDGKYLCEHCYLPVRGHKRCSKCEILLHEWNEKYKCENPECRETFNLQHTWEVDDTGLCVACFLGYNPAPYVSHSYEEMAKEYGYSRERIRQWTEEIEEKIKEHPIFMKILKERTSKPCEYCGKPMYLSEGQIAKYHKQCRTEGREQERKNKK